MLIINNYFYLDLYNRRFSLISLYRVLVIVVFQENEFQIQEILTRLGFRSHFACLGSSICSMLKLPNRQEPVASGPFCDESSCIACFIYQVRLHRRQQGIVVVVVPGLRGSM